METKKRNVGVGSGRTPGIKEKKPRESRYGGPLGRPHIPEEDRRDTIAVNLKKKHIKAVYEEMGGVREGNRWIREIVEKAIEQMMLETDN